MIGIFLWSILYFLISLISLVHHHLVTGQPSSVFVSALNWGLLSGKMDHCPGVEHRHTVTKVHSAIRVCNKFCILRRPYVLHYICQSQIVSVHSINRFNLTLLFLLRCFLQVVSSRYFVNHNGMWCAIVCVISVTSLFH